MGETPLSSAPLSSKVTGLLQKTNLNLPIPSQKPTLVGFFLTIFMTLLYYAKCVFS